MSVFASVHMCSMERENLTVLYDGRTLHINTEDRRGGFAISMADGSDPLAVIAELLAEQEKLNETKREEK